MSSVAPNLQNSRDSSSVDGAGSSQVVGETQQAAALDFSDSGLLLTDAQGESVALSNAPLPCCEEVSSSRLAALGSDASEKSSTSVGSISVTEVSQITSDSITGAINASEQQPTLTTGLDFDGGGLTLVDASGAEAQISKLSGPCCEEVVTIAPAAEKAVPKITVREESPSQSALNARDSEMNLKPSESTAAQRAEPTVTLKVAEAPVKNPEPSKAAPESVIKQSSPAPERVRQVEAPVRASTAVASEGKRAGKVDETLRASSPTSPKVASKLASPPVSVYQQRSGHQQKSGASRGSASPGAKSVIGSTSPNRAQQVLRQASLARGAQSTPPTQRALQAAAREARLGAIQTNAQLDRRVNSAAKNGGVLPRTQASQPRSSAPVMPSRNNAVRSSPSGVNRNIVGSAKSGVKSISTGSVKQVAAVTSRASARVDGAALRAGMKTELSGAARAINRALRILARSKDKSAAPRVAPKLRASSRLRSNSRVASKAQRTTKQREMRQRERPQRMRVSSARPGIKLRTIRKVGSSNRAPSKLARGKVQQKVELKARVSRVGKGLTSPSATRSRIDRSRSTISPLRVSRGGTRILSRPSRSKIHIKRLAAAVAKLPSRARAGSLVKLAAKLRNDVSPAITRYRVDNPSRILSRNQRNEPYRSQVVERSKGNREVAFIGRYITKLLRRYLNPRSELLKRMQREMSVGELFALVQTLHRNARFERRYARRRRRTGATDFDYCDSDLGGASQSAEVTFNDESEYGPDYSQKVRNEKSSPNLSQDTEAAVDTSSGMLTNDQTPITELRVGLVRDNSFDSDYDDEANSRLPLTH